MQTISVLHRGTTAKRLVTVNYAPSTAFMNRFTLIDGLTLGLGVDPSVRAYWKTTLSGPLPPRKRRAQRQQAAHQAAECCTGVQQALWRCGAVSPPCPWSRRAAARPSTSCRRCALPSGSTGCSLSTRSFAQRSARATPRKADPQSAREAVCGRPGKRALASSAAMPSARASEQRESGAPPPLRSLRKRHGPFT